MKEKRSHCGLCGRFRLLTIEHNHKGLICGSCARDLRKSQHKKQKQEDHNEYNTNQL